MKKQFDLTNYNFSVKEGVLTLEEKPSLYNRPNNGQSCWSPKLYPNCFEELSQKHQDKITAFNAFVPKKYLALNKLEQFRNAWNEIDGFEADWNNSDQVKWGIYLYNHEIRLTDLYFMSKFLHFKTKETVNLFLETFRDLIEDAKEFI
jgi:hypothetical protein